ncbi:MAG: ABC transporter ATP-binding protein [Vicinamibacterales bacterium]
MIDAVDLSRRFGERLAIDGATFAVGAGEVLALVGPNGAGKTTLFRMLAGLISPSRGRATVAGLAVDAANGAAVRARVGLLTEAPGLWDRLTVRTNLLTYAELQGVARPAAAVTRVLDRLGLADRAGEVSAVLSAGLRRRVALARAVLHAPPVLLLDEPTSGLDPAAARDVRSVIRELSAEGVSTLVSTHNLAEAEELGDRIGVVNGRLLALDTADALRASSGPPAILVDVEGEAAAWQTAARAVATAVEASASRLRATLAPGRSVPDLVAALVAAGARVTGVRTERRGLEAAYLALVEHP